MALLVLALSAIAAPGIAKASCVVGQVGVKTLFSETGAEECYTVPASVSTVHIVAIGAAGASSSGNAGGGGGTVVADVSLPDGTSTL